MRTTTCLPALLLLAPTAHAEPIVKDIPPGVDEIVAIGEGDPAPYRGQLFTDATALRWANWLRQYRTAYEVDMAAQLELRKIEREASAERLRAQQKYNERTAEAYEQRLAGQQTGGAWYDTFWAGAVAGTVTTTAVLAVGVWASR